jgi:hypothetical protein
MDILLIEPNYPNKYPPLGLMKIARFHGLRGDRVIFFKGNKQDYYTQYEKSKQWDRIYIGTMFTFHYSSIIKSIEMALRHTSKKNLYVGGVAATLLAKDIKKETKISPIKGLLNVEGKIGLKGDGMIDSMIPDYSILDQISYKYPTNNAYIGYTTRGCVNHCPFCAVPTLEPEYCGYYDLKKYVRAIEKEYGEKRNLLLLDNNVLASKEFNRIIKDIKDLGFERDAKASDGKRRYVDFNQGLDARLLTEPKAKLLSEIALRPARLAFDHIELMDLYCKKVKLMADYGVEHLSNFLLFNFKDKPEDLYERIMINIDLNEEKDISIFSFPMKFVPLDAHDRSYVGENWTKKQLRSIQAILNATHGVVGPKRGFIERAFGETLEDFEKLLWMPEDYIMYREKHEESEALEWDSQYLDLSDSERKLMHQILEGNYVNIPLLKMKGSPKIKRIIKHYGPLMKRGQARLDEFNYKQTAPG